MALILDSHVTMPVADRALPAHPSGRKQLRSGKDTEEFAAAAQMIARAAVPGASPEDDHSDLAPADNCREPRRK
ncbi:MAG: hypothetical protein ABSE43_00210 [Steroidobacteraceae bacterium]